MLKITLVEDEEIICASIATWLSREGAEVRSFISPARCLAERAWQGADILVTDVLMPEHDGIELGLLARSEGYAGPILFITAVGDTRLANLDPKLQPCGVMRKPFRARELGERIHQALAERER